MNSTYAGKQQKFIISQRPSCNSRAYNKESFELDGILDRLDTQDQYVFQRIVNSMKFGNHDETEMLANELCKIRLLKTKLILVKRFYEKIRQ